MKARIALGLTLGLVATVGCTQEQAFIGPNNGLFSFALTPETPPYIMVEDAEFFLVETRVEFPITPPTDEEMAELGTIAAAPYPRAPWVARDSLAIEVDLAVTNLGDEVRNIDLIANGFNEFHEYMPGFRIEDDDLIVDFNQWERDMMLQPGETKTLTIREEEFDEAMVDLATVVNAAPNSNLVVFWENQSQFDERTRQYIPEVVPGLTGFRLGVFSGSNAPVVIEATVRVRDLDDRLADPEDPTEWWATPAPAPFIPVAPMEE